MLPNTLGAQAESSSRPQLSKKTGKNTAPFSPPPVSPDEENRSLAEATPGVEAEREATSQIDNLIMLLTPKLDIESKPPCVNYSHMPASNVAASHLFPCLISIRQFCKE